MDGGAADDLFNPFSLDGDGDGLFSPEGPASRPAKAVPKLAGKFQPKIKGKIPKPEPAAETTPEHKTIGKQEEAYAFVEAKPALLPVKNQDEASTTFVGEFSGLEIEDGITVDDSSPMDLDDVQEEDVVVREFDVYLSPSPLEADTQLYVVQYPLRPSWRPYDLDKVSEVRVKPKQTSVEFDIAIDYPENYDSEIEGYSQQGTRTFSSSRAPLITSHCVGFLKRNQLHLNPVNAVVQLRPSIDCTKSGQEKKSVARSQENDVLSNDENGDASLEPSSSKGKQVAVTTHGNQTEAEDWVPVEFHPPESSISVEYRGKMEAGDGGNIPFSMGSGDYLTNLCPKISTGTRGFPRQYLFTLPLEERFKVWFLKGPQVNRFSSLMHLAPKDSAKEDILALLSQFAVLVQGHWVSKSSLLFEENDKALARDYILLLFHKSNVISNKKIDPIRSAHINPAVINQIMGPLARERPSEHFKDWKFREATDTEFLKCYSDSDIVRDQERFWNNLEQRIESELRMNIRNNAAIRRGLAQRGPPTNSIDQIGRKNPNEGSGSAAIPDQARDILPKAIIKVLRGHKVCGLSTICQKLRDIVINETVLSKKGPSVAAACNFITPSKELHDMIIQVAFEIHDVYVLKSIDAVIDPFRKVVIDLLRVSPRTEKLKKAQIFAAAEKVLGREIPNTEYNLVLNELCIFKGGGWVLKPGDGKPD